MSTNDSAVAVIEQSVDANVVEWDLNAFPEDRFNRLVPVATIQLPTDLLRPVVQVVQLNPDPKAGDVYSSSDMPNGHAAPTKVGLRKFAMAAGISFVDERRTDDGSDPDVIEVTCVAELLMPTGQRIRATGMKRVDLNAQKWASDDHRKKYRSFFLEHVASRAQNRAIRALLSLRGSYPLGLYQRPFAVVSFAPNLNHPEVRSRMLDAMAGVSAQLYGPAAAKQVAAGQVVDVTPAADEDPAPATPTVLPGETLAKAGDLPDWASPTSTTTEAAAEPKGKAKPKPLVERLTESAEPSAMQGPVNEAQRGRLTALIGRDSGLDWALETLPVLLAAFGGDFAPADMTAAQAQAIANVADSFESATPPVAFADAWREAAELAKKQAAA